MVGPMIRDADHGVFPRHGLGIKRRRNRLAPLVRGRLAHSASGVWKCAAGPKVCIANFGILLGTAQKNVTEPADKPGFVVDSHSSRRIVTDTLKQPTRRHRGPRHCLPIWSCSRWGLPCRSVAGLAVRSYRTISPLPDPLRAIGGIFLLHFPSARAAQALPGTVPCGARTFLGIGIPKNAMTRLSGRLRRRHCRTPALRTAREHRAAERQTRRPRDTASSAGCGSFACR